MTLKIAVVGAVGSGKTLFCINWSEYLGATRLYYLELNGAGGRRGVLTPPAARQKMVNRHCRRARTFVLNRPGRFPSRLTLDDTFSLPEKTVLSGAERSRLYATLQVIWTADVIINLVDLTCSDPRRREFVAAVDRYLFDFCSRRPTRYWLVGNKLDLLNGRVEMPRWPVSGTVTGISALKGSGFALLTGQVIGRS